MKRSLEGEVWMDCGGCVWWGDLWFCALSGAPIPLHRFPMTKYLFEISIRQLRKILANSKHEKRCHKDFQNPRGIVPVQAHDLCRPSS